MPVLNELLEANKRFAEGFEKGDLPMPPARQVAVLTCMDARLHPKRFLGLDVGDAHVIRNAGGRASDDAVRSLVISSKLLGTREFVVIHHTDCGMLTFTSQELQKRLTEQTGADASGIEFLTFTDLEESVLEDVGRIKDSPFIADDIPVSGFVYDVQSGRLKEVVGPTAGRAG